MTTDGMEVCKLCDRVWPKGKAHTCIRINSKPACSAQLRAISDALSVVEAKHVEQEKREAYLIAQAQEWQGRASSLSADLARVTGTNAELLQENADLTRVLGETVLAIERGKHTAQVVLPGWLCPKCHVFNGEAKELYLVCRCCGAKRDGQ